MRRSKVLDNQIIEKLFGANAGGVVVYDYASDSYNTTKYHGRQMAPSSEYAYKPCYRTFKKMIDTAPEFSDAFEMVGFAAMTVDCSNYLCDKGNATVWRTANVFVKNPKYNRRGLQIVGTIIVRDKKTGEILPVPDRWMLLKDGRLFLRGKSYVDGAQKNLDSVREYHKDSAQNPKSIKAIERYERKLYTAQRIANCENREEVAAAIYWQMPYCGANAICDAYRNNAIMLYNQAYKTKGK